MIIFPAIDLRGGRVVRLRQGRADAQTVYSDDPAEIARRWQSQGAEWLHLVNLDGAFGDDSAPNLVALKGILAAISIPAQFGGGVRDVASIESLLRSGVQRVIIGTAALQNPALVSTAIDRFGADRIVVGIDAYEGRVATHGWRHVSEITAIDLAKQMAARGVVRIVCTDVARDGMLGGIDANAMAELAQAANVRVIASGGVASLRDLEALKAREQDGIEGVIIGQALYTGAVSLKEAHVASKR